MGAILFTAIFGGLMVSTLVWFGRVRRLFSSLEQRHQAKYIDMGRPSLFMRNNIETNIALVRFLFRKEYLALGDSAIAAQGASMRIHLIGHLAGFGILLVGFFAMAASNAP